VSTENKYTPAVTSAEIADWENRFKEAVSPLVQFNSDEGKPSMNLYNGTSGVEATWSGVVQLTADNFVAWSFSIQNEPFVEAKFNLNLESKKIIDSLYDFYNIWRGEWAKSLSIPPSVAPEKLPVTEAYNTGGNRNRSQLINDHSERMKRLAGL